MIENFLKKNNNGKSFLVGESVSSICFFQYVYTYFIKLIVTDSHSQVYWKVTDLRTSKKFKREIQSLVILHVKCRPQDRPFSLRISRITKNGKLRTLQISAMILVKHSIGSIMYLKSSNCLNALILKYPVSVKMFLCNCVS